MLRFAPDPSPPTPQPIPDDDGDAWLDDVRRWYYGGTEPGADAEGVTAQAVGPGLDRQWPAQ